LSPPPEVPSTLIARVVRETLSFGAVQTGAQIFALLSNIVLARVLLPADFGIYDICGFFIGIGVLLGDGGLGASLIRKPEEPTPEEYGSIFLANVAVGGLLTCGFIAAAPLLARLYGLESTTVWVLMALAPNYLVNSLRSYPMIRIERELRFGKIARIDLIVLLLRQTTAVTLALLHFGVWALVLANVGAATLAVALTFMVQPGLPRLRFSKRAFMPLLLFGSKVQGLVILSFFKDNVSNAMLGALAGPAAVGLFNFAMKYIQTPLLAVNALGRVQLPTYARLQTDASALYSAVRGSLRIMFLLGIPFLMVLTTGAVWLIPTIWHVKWVPSIVVAYGLLPNMVGGLAASSMFTLLQARNEAGYALSVFAVWTSTTWILSLLAYHLGFGLLGVAAAHSLVTVVIVCLLLARSGRVLGHSLFGVVGPPTFAGAMGVAAVIALRWLPPSLAFLHHPAVLLVLPVATYVLAELLLEGRLVREDVRKLHQIISPRSAPAAAP
jgi:O-antigen/teichoic acid export membrane protein